MEVEAFLKIKEYMDNSNETKIGNLKVGLKNKLNNKSHIGDN